MKTHITHSPNELTDSELTTRIHELSHDERTATAQLVAHLAEFETRGLHHAEGCSSLFTYCVDVLHFSEHAAYNRIAAARASRRFPAVLERLADGSIHLTAVTLLAPHLTAENCTSLLTEARHKSKAQVLEIIARLRPLPAVPASVRKLPARVEAVSPPSLTLETPATPPSAPPTKPPVVVPLAPSQYKVQFTASQEMRERLMEAQALLRHRIPDGNPAEVLDLALKVLLKEIRKRKAGVVERPLVVKSSTVPTRPGSSKEPLSATALSRPGSGSSETTERSAGRAARLIPASVRRAVWVRDGGCCAFRGRNGRRCAEKGFLEFHHVTPHATGGPATVENIELRCRGHNAHESKVFFGGKWAAVLCEQPRAS